MNLPNKLTVGRLVLTVLFLLVFFSGIPWGETVALVLFLVASITDHYDGKIARRDGLITNFGILMDPLVDKILTCSAFIAFVGRDLMPAWMVVIIVGRELAITGLRLLAAAQNMVLAAEGFGKHKTVSQIVAIVATLVLVSYTQWGGVLQSFFAWPVLWIPGVEIVAEVSQWVAVFFTGLSGYIYLRNNSELYLKDV